MKPDETSVYWVHIFLNKQYENDPLLNAVSQKQIKYLNKKCKYFRQANKMHCWVKIIIKLPVDSILSPCSQMLYQYNSQIAYLHELFLITHNEFTFYFVYSNVICV